MKKKLFAITASLALFGTVALAQAALITIGTATYGGSDYNLIWDDNNNGNSVVWLDYTNSATNWSAQNSWAANLDSDLTINLNAGYSVAWNESAWRLPSTVDGPWVEGYEGDPDHDGIYSYTGGYNLANSEMGHLFYTELGNLGYWGTDGGPQAGYGLVNSGDFENLLNSYYFSGTAYTNNPVLAWSFSWNHGYQYNYNKDVINYGLAVRSGSVSSVPSPGTIYLLASGLGCLGVLNKRKKRSYQLP